MTASSMAEIRWSTLISISGKGKPWRLDFASKSVRPSTQQLAAGGILSKQ
jgi:hypothetical protein